MRRLTAKSWIATVFGVALLVVVACQSDNAGSSPEIPTATSIPSAEPTQTPEPTLNTATPTPSPTLEPVVYSCVDTDHQSEMATSATDLVALVQGSMAQLQSYRVEMDISFPGLEESAPGETRLTYQWSRGSQVESRMESEIDAFPSTSTIVDNGRRYWKDPNAGWFEILLGDGEDPEFDDEQNSGLTGIPFVLEFFDPDFTDHPGGVAFNTPFEGNNSHQLSNTHLGVNWLVLDPETCLPSNFVKRGSFFVVDGTFFGYNLPLEIDVPGDEELAGTISSSELQSRVEALTGQAP